MCEHSNDIQAYYDGQLTGAKRADFESHLASCEPCRRSLAEFRAMSQTLTAAAMPSIPIDLSSRILAACQAARRAQDKGTRKLAGWLTAAAAIVLAVAMLRVSMLTGRQSENVAIDVTGSVSRDWELAAVMPPDRQLEDAGSGSANIVQLAQWMARDLSLDERH